MNLGYGIKYYVLKEEASMPSVGYSDVVQRMVQAGTRGLMPFTQMGLPLKVRSHDAIKKLILNRADVKEAIAALVKEKLDHSRGVLL